jgi:hypothetical protein
LPDAFKTTPLSFQLTSPGLSRTSRSLIIENSSRNADSRCRAREALPLELARNRLPIGLALVIL